MQVELLFFAALRDRVGESRASLSLPAAACTVGQLRALVQERFPTLRGRLDSVRVAVNEDFALDDQTLADGDVVALIPPVCGG
jgi:molybdopterin synthase sulfur carrier subunit